MTTSRSLDQADIATLTRTVRGAVHRPSDPGYPIDGFNLAVSRRPWAVVDVLDADDVAAAIAFAGAAGMTVAVHATGHGGTSVDGHTLVIRTGLLDVCDVDPGRRTARVGAGVRWQTVLDAAAPHGLAPLCGSSTTIGVAGFLSGGGIGPLVRTVGASSDHVRSMTAITGNGELITATPELNPELFWGLRGGKATLGIITEVTVDLLPIPEIYGGALYFDGSDADRVVRAWRDWAMDLPRTANTSLALLRLPEMPGVPPMLAGRLTIAVRYTGIADLVDHSEILAPMRDLMTPLLDAVGPMPYAAIGAIHADPVDPMPTHEGAALLCALPDAAIDALLEAVGPDSGSVLTSVEMRRLGGAFADEPAVRSALCHRDAALTLTTIGVLAPPIADAVVTDSTRTLTGLAPWTTGAHLPNFAASSDPAIIARCYDDDTRSWLAALAYQHDQHGVLRVGQVVRG